MNGLIWFWPGVIVALAASVLLASPIARALGTMRGVAWFLVLSFGVIVAATLTPIHAPNGIDTSIFRPCDLSRHGLASFADIEAITDVSLNIAVFIPLGIAVAMLPRTARTVAIAGSTVLLPVAIEGLQYLVPVLARGCESGDVIDNLTGLVIGLAVGVIARSVGARARGRR
jgi:hypothetical protein